MLKRLANTGQQSPPPRFNTPVTLHPRKNRPTTVRQGNPIMFSCHCAARFYRIAARVGFFPDVNRVVRLQVLLCNVGH
jgi:hypothetical protein